ncbi:ccsA, partial [Symbiodinium sp. KB8]
ARQRRQILLPTILVLALTYFSPAFVPAPQGKKAPEQVPNLSGAVGAGTLFALTAPANAVDDPLAHGAPGVMEAGDLQGWAERAAFGGLLVSTFLAWWRGTLGSGQASTEGKPPSFYAMSFANLALVVLLSNRWLESGHFPLSNMYESLSFLAWGVTAVTLYFTASQASEAEELKAFDMQTNSKSSEAKQNTTDIA